MKLLTDLKDSYPAADYSVLAFDLTTILKTLEVLVINIDHVHQAHYTNLTGRAPFPTFSGFLAL